MRVLHILHMSLPILNGYSIRSDYLIRNQKDQGITPTIVTSAQHPNSRHILEEIKDIEYWRTPTLSHKLPPIAREWALIRALQARVQEVIETARPDIIHAHSPVLVGFPALQAAKRRRIPFVYEVRDLWENASVDRGKFKENRSSPTLERFNPTRASICSLKPSPKFARQSLTHIS